MQAIRLRQIWEHARARLARSPLTIALPLGIVLGLAVYLCCRGRGYFGDEGSACTIAQGILLGKFPYQSYFNEKPPLQYFWTAAVMAISRPTLSATRLASTVALVLTAVCILSGHAARTRNWPALLGWTVLLFFAAIDFSAYEGIAEVPLAFLYCASALLLLDGDLGERKLRLKAALQGAIFGIAIGFRQHEIAPALVMLFLPNAKLPKRAYCFGLALAIVCWLGPLLALGLGPDLFNSIVAFHFNNALVKTYFTGPAWSEREGYALWFLCLAWLASLKTYRKNLLWLVFWFVAMASPAFARMDAFRLWPSTAAMLVLIARAAPGNGPVARLPAIAFALIAFYMLLKTYPLSSSANFKVSNAIVSATSPEDHIWVGPFDPLAYCLAQRRPASRYYFLTPWTAKAEVRREIMADIARTAPKLVILVPSGPYGISQVLPELLGLVAKKYHATGTHDGLVFYQRND